jgi:hypothetical protein
VAAVAARLRLLGALAGLVAAERELLRGHQRQQQQTLVAVVAEQVRGEQTQLRVGLVALALFS